MITTEEQTRIKKIWNDNKINSRKSYRTLHKENPDLKLPNSRAIEKEFGSFSQFKSLMICDSIVNDDTESFTSTTISKPEVIKEPIKEETLLDSLTNIFNQFNISNRDQYRKVRRENPDLNAPSVHQISKEFCSFSHLKSLIDNGVEKVQVNKDCELDDKRIEKWREAVKIRRKEMFADKRLPYRWDPKSRSKISSLFHFFRG